MVIAWIVIAAVAVMSAVLLSGKGGFLIAGYNTASRAEKSRYDEKKLCRTTGVMLAVITAATALLILFPNQFSIIAFFVVIVSAIAAGLIYANTRCFKPKPVELQHLPKSQEYRQEKKRNALSLFIVCAVVAALFLGIGFLCVYEGRPPVYTVSGGVLNISTVFGQSVPLSDIESVELKETVPEQLNKTNGFSLGSVLKGSFESNGEKLRLYVDTAKPPFIYLHTKNGLMIVNGQTKADTQALLSQLAQKR